MEGYVGGSGFRCTCLGNEDWEELEDARLDIDESC